MSSLLLHLSIHGLIRGQDLELGRDADTGGQTKYVVDLARALAERSDVQRVILVTRRVVDSRVSEDYAKEVEELAKGLQIVRIEAGPEGYIPKEQLWEYLDTFADNLAHWLECDNVRPSLVHSHYADAGYVAVRLSHLLGVPLVHTGHSLGRDKRKRLLARGLSSEKIEDSYNIARRIEAEEEVLANAALIVSSTRDEVEQQYAMYDYYDPGCMSVIPPGTDLSLFRPDAGNEPEPFAGDLSQFLRDPAKPVILALSRPDERKNLLTLIEAYGESDRLQEIANLLIVAGTREDISALQAGAREVLTQILVLMDRYNLYGRLAIPKKHAPEEVPAIYRYAAARAGVFINPALTEPFGITLLEAAGTGLPVVATENGGPRDIIANCENGILIDPLDRTAITHALERLLTNSSAWTAASQNGLHGVAEHYSWKSHADRYMKAVAKLVHKRAPAPPRRREATLSGANRALVIDLEHALAGDPSSVAKLVELIRANRKDLLFGIVTGRKLDAGLSAISQYQLPPPNLLITDVGTRVHYGRELLEDEDWADHIRYQWNRQRAVRTLERVQGITPQQPPLQSPVKASWYLNPEVGPSLDEINSLLRQREITANAFVSLGMFLDILPARASKGLALRHATARLDIALERVLAAGTSGADEDMVTGNTLGVVLADPKHDELAHLPTGPRLLKAQTGNACGMLEAIQHYDFFGECAPPSET